MNSGDWVSWIRLINRLDYRVRVIFKVMCKVILMKESNKPDYC